MFRLRGTYHAWNIQRGHQAHRADRQLRVLFDGVIVENVDLQASPAKIDDAARRRLRSERSHGRLAPRRYLRSLAGVHTEAVFSLTDPVPGIAELTLIPYLVAKRGY